MSLKAIHDPKEMSIGQLYLFRPRYSGEVLYRGICKGLTENEADFTFTRPGSTYQSHQTIHFDENQNQVWIYNASIYHKFQKLLEQQQKERDDLLAGKVVIVEEISKKKWYERFLKKTCN